MIDYLAGVVKNVREKSITVLVNGLGLLVLVPRASDYVQDQSIQLYTYLHWNQEQGFSLLGFATELERTVFLMIIDCPKIGPSIGLNILSQVNAGAFLKLISAQDEKGLSALNGIGPKKAEQLIVELKHKVSKLLVSGTVPAEDQQSFVEWHNVSAVLSSLNYSKPEVTKAMTYLAAKYNGQNCSLDQLIRSALAYLATGV
jgi:Holliday junction DNA helicase RuvA